jgi:dTDP-4-amino-4,6-dideoxy-D-galactose acyltransferase
MAWDTEFWGLRVGRATRLDGVSEWAVANTVGLVCLLVDTMAEAQEAQERGFRLMDVRLTLDRTPSVMGSSARLVRDADVPELLEIARTAFTHTRFYADPRLDDVRCGELYVEWTRSSCDGASDVVLVAHRDGRVAGYVTVNRVGDNCEIGLIAVAEEFRGKGVGADLVLAANDWARSRDAWRMTVVTQGANRDALRTFERCGFRVCGMELWLHRWYDA